MNRPFNLAATKSPEAGLPSRKSAFAFTLIEMLAAIAIIAILAAILLPALSQAHAKAQSTTCLGNLKQLQLAWSTYAQDSRDCLAPDRAERREFDLTGIEGSWVLGNAQTDTNEANIRAGVLYPYAGSPGVYRCPSDHSTVRDRPYLTRDRGYSINFWLNSEMHTGSVKDEVNTTELNLRRLSQVAVNGADRIFVFIDEHQLSIDDGAFSIGNPDFGNPNHETGRTPPFWGSLPADRHRQGCNLSYADGHASYHRWKGRPNLQDWTERTMVTDTNDLADLRWLQSFLPRTR